MILIHRLRAVVFVVMCVGFVTLGVAAFLQRGRPAPTVEVAALSRGAIPHPPPHAAPAPASPGEDCGQPRLFAPAAQDNAVGLATLAVAPFGVGETGWAVYAPMAAREIASSCAPDAPGFAAALARWQAAHGLSGGGRMDAPTLSTLSTVWLLRRPFVLLSRKACPPPPDLSSLARADPAEAYGGKVVLARPAALAAFRRMASALRAVVPEAPPLTIASAFRGVDEEAARCADGRCGSPGKARCSAHRTGLAFDLLLGAAPGSDPFSTDPANRLYQAGTPTYRWLVANADRFGFVNYPYEPWHWEWTGEAV